MNTSEKSRPIMILPMKSIRQSKEAAEKMLQMHDLLLFESANWDSWNPQPEKNKVKE